MRRYQWSKALGGLVFAGIFAGWMVLEWSSPMMRVIAGVLMVVTLWVTTASVLIDAARSRGRQLTLSAGRLDITTPGAPATPRAPGTPATSESVTLADVAYARWRDGMSDVDGGAAGLVFFDHNDRPLARLDNVFLRDEAEARAFVGWLREHAEIIFEVRWPKVRVR